MTRCSQILIVDDDYVNINILNDILKKDYQIKVAMNGKEALEQAISHPQPELFLFV